MRVAIVSGKGGTGKTSVSLAMFMSLSGHYRMALADTDVEESDCHLFLQPKNLVKYEVTEPVARINPDKCEFSGKCADTCRFGALVVIPGKKVLVFDDLCNGCGACQLVCPTHAIYYEDVTAGWINKGDTEYGPLIWGSTKIGHRSPVGVIDAVFDHIPENIEHLIIDSPPGSSDAAVHAIMHADFVIVVAEPTVFGKHDANLVIEAIKELKKPFGVIINKAGIGDKSYPKRLKRKGIDVLMEIPFSTEVARAIASGRSMLEAMDGLDQEFINLFKRIER